MNFIIPFTKRLRAFQAKKFVKDKTDGNLLDICCGDKYFINTFKNLSVEGIDRIYGQDAEQDLNYADNSFDYVTMLAVVEHLNDYREVLAECHRIMKDNGLLVLTTPKKKSEWIVHIYGKKYCEDHKKHFTKKDFENIDGFKLIHYSTFELGMNQLIALRKFRE